MLVASTLLLSLAGMLPQGGSAAPVVINEFAYVDGPPVDDHEFVELYNSAAQLVDLSGWTLESVNASTTRSWAIPAGTMLAPGGYYVMGASQVPNPKQALTSYWLATPQPHNLFLNNVAGLLLKDAAGAVVDSVHYETNRGLWAGANPEGEGIWGRNLTSDVFPYSWQRAVDGSDTDNNGNDFVLLPWTPGSTNDRSGLPTSARIPYANDFDSELVETLLAEWGRTVEFAYPIDPTKVSTHNPNRIPLSPQGGNALAFWPDSGANAGNNNMLLATLPSDVVFEAWVYFDAMPEATGHETWSIGVGATGSAFQPPDPEGLLGTPRNGNMGGVSWTFQVTQNGAVLYLIDHNDGGWGARALTDATVIGRIDVVAGQNDGWQKLRLERSGGMVLGSFGGTLGCADGTTFWAPITSNNPTTLYVGYRESISDNSTARPPTLDDIVVKPSASAVRFFGTAVPTTAGTPVLGTDGPPTLGHAGWGVTLSGLVPGQATVLMLGATRLAVPFDMSVLGGQPGSLLEIVPLIALPLPSNPQGASRLPIAIPCQLQWQGNSLYWQVFDPDPSLGFALPLGNSAAMETRLGV